MRLYGTVAFFKGGIVQIRRKNTTTGKKITVLVDLYTSDQILPKVKIYNQS